MTTIGFIGLGNMGLPMACNLLKAGHQVTGFDVVPGNVAAFVEEGGTGAARVAEAVSGAEAIVSMLPEGKHVRAVYLDAGGVLASAAPGALLIDCSTIDIATAREVAAAASAKGLDMVDAPVSGGVGGAEAAGLTFMVGGSETAYGRAEPILAHMGKRIVHTGGPGTGEAAKICNNLILGISMIGVSEAFALGRAMGLADEKLFEVASTSSGQCWSLTSYCPVPGPVEASPANRDYAPGFAASMMLKDLRLARAAADDAKAAQPLGRLAEAVYTALAEAGLGQKDFSAVMPFLESGKLPAKLG